MALPLTGEELKARINVEMELARREVERASHDLWQVYNPLDRPFRFMYNRYWHSVPAKSYKNFEKFLVRQYFRAICNEIIGEQIGKEGKALMEKRKEQFGQQFMDHYEENVQVWDRVPKINDPELVNEIGKIVIIGLVEEYGMEEPEPEQVVADLPQDFAPVHDRIFSAFSKRVAIDHASTPPETKVDNSVLESILEGKQVDDKPTTPIKIEKAKVNKEDLQREVTA